MNAEHSDQQGRVLALDVRGRWLGFVVFASQTRLLDFGLVRITSSHRGGVRFVRLLHASRPRLVVLQRLGKRPDTRSSVQMIVRLSRCLSVPVDYVSKRTMQRHFNAFGIRNKEQRATFLAHQFPELLWRVPPKRKRWQHEHQNMPIFDAAAIGTAYIHSNKEITS